MQGIIERQPSYIDYPGAESPDYSCACPRCGRIWEGWNTKLEPRDCFKFDNYVEWECDDVGLTTHGDKTPVRNDMCRICAWEDHFEQDERAYIDQEVDKREVIAYCLKGTRHSRDFDVDAANYMFDTIANHDKEYMKELIRDFIEECEKDDFIDWLMGRGFTAH